MSKENNQKVGNLDKLKKSTSILVRVTEEKQIKKYSKPNKSCGKGKSKKNIKKKAEKGKKIEIRSKSEKKNNQKDGIIHSGKSLKEV